MRESCKKKFPQITPDTLHSLAVELRLIYLDIKDSKNEQQMPQLHNTDGEPFVLIKLHYDLQCTPLEAFEKLKKLSLDMSEEELLSDAAYSADGKLAKATINWLKKKNKLHKDWENTVMGTITLDGSSLAAEVNSENRAQKIRQKIETLLREKAVYKTSVFQSVQQAMEEIKERGDTPESLFEREEQEKFSQLPEVQKRLREISEKHWQAWLDQKIPALGNKTPRQAAKTALGREQLEALFLLYETYAGKEGAALQPDIKKLRGMLGLENKG
jgi:hypothetical protein